MRKHHLLVFLLVVAFLPQCQKTTESSSTSANCDSNTSTDDSTDPFYSSQWHLSNSGGMTDLNMGTVWTTTKGNGVRINVVDDGMEILHEDLTANVAPNSGLNFYAGVSGFSSSASDPTPASTGTPAHGTAVTGLIAARDLNGYGGRGVAPRACMSGINLLGGSGTSSTQESQAMTHNSGVAVLSNNSWGPTDKKGTLAASSSLWQSAIDSGLASNSGKGILYAWAAGNGARVVESQTTGYETDNSNHDGYANYYGVMAVCGVQDDGTRVRYSEKGANLWVCGYSQTTTYYTNARGLTTTDLSGTRGFNTTTASTASDTSLASIGGSFMDYRHGSYTRIMNGTSGATPIVVGVAALMLKKNPNLTARDVRLILAETARKNDPTDTDWTTNAGTKISGGGAYNISHKYGFGLVDATAAVTLAGTWTNVAAEATAYDSGTKTVNQAFSDNNTTGVTDSITVSGSTITKIEFVEVTLTATGDIGDVDVRLTNASGTTSILAEAHDCYASSSATTVASSCGQTYSAWRFGSARHLGEAANQVWTLRVSDRKTGTSTSGGNFTSWRLKIRGRAS